MENSMKRMLIEILTTCVLVVITLTMGMLYGGQSAQFFIFAILSSITLGMSVNEMWSVLTEKNETNNH